MKKTLKYFAAAVIIAIAASCAKEADTNETEIPAEEQDNPVEEIIPEGYVKLTFKTSADVKTSVNGKVVSWSANDQIKVCWDGGSAVSESVDIDGSSANFTVTVDGSATDFYAVYPSSINAEILQGTFNVDIPQNQSGRFADADILVAKTTASELTYAFHHAVSLVHFEISSANAKSISRAKFVDLTKNSALYGTVGFTFDANNDIETTAAPAYTDNDVINITAVQSGTDNYIAIIPGKALAGFGLRLGSASEWFTGLVGENAITLGERLGLGEVDTKINDGDWYIKETASGTGDGTSWANAGGPDKLQSLIGDYSSGDAKNLARVWRANGKTIYVAEGNYIAPGVNGFTSRIINDEETLTYTIEGGYTSSGTKSSAAHTVFGPADGTDPYRAFFFYGNVHVTLKDLYFSNHVRTSSAGGGAIYFSQPDNTDITNVTFNGCVFSGNATQNDRGGGAVLADAKSSFTNCEFSNNSTNLAGGAIMVDDKAGEVSMSGCTFTSNTATAEARGNGGALYIKRPTTITNCTFSTNSSTTATKVANNTYGNGGAIYANNNVVCTNCVFNGNYSTDAGCIYLNGEYTLKADKCKFIGNYTDGNRWFSSTTYNGREGSGVFSFKDQSSQSASAFFNSCEFRNNYSKSTVIQCSNVIYAFPLGTTMGFNNCLFYGNTNSEATDDKKPGWDVYSRGDVIMINTTMIDNCSNAVFYVTSTNTVLYNSVCINTVSANAAIRGVAGWDGTHDYNILNAYHSDGNVTAATNEVTDTALGNGDDTYMYDTHAAGITAGVTTGMSYYYWDGTTPAFTKAAKTAVAGAIPDGAFKTWLTDLGALNVDIRGNTRNNNVWPGCYDAN